GFNVYPNEVEDVIAMMPGVLEVAAVGVPDEKSGEAVKLVIVRKDPALTVEQSKAHARENLTGYKQPPYVGFRDELPRSRVGSIHRGELREGLARARPRRGRGLLGESTEGGRRWPDCGPETSRMALMGHFGLRFASFGCIESPNRAIC